MRTCPRLGGEKDGGEKSGVAVPGFLVVKGVEHLVRANVQAFELAFFLDGAHDVHLGADHIGQIDARSAGQNGIFFAAVRGDKGDSTRLAGGEGAI